MGLRALAWIGATLLAAGVLSFVAMPASWPLPTGLGGLIGNGFTGLAAMVTGDAAAGGHLGALRHHHRHSGR